MGIADKNGFVSRLDRQLAWRKKEIGDLAREAADLYAAAGAAPQRLPTLRAGLCLLYAHWEGFVRNSLNLMLEHVRQSAVPSSEFVPRLRAAILLEYVTTNKGAMGLDLCVNYLERDQGEMIALLEIPAVGKLQGNLSFERFEELITIFGVSVPAVVVLKRNFINVSLLKARNEIAHGEGRIVELSAFHDAKDQVIELLDSAKGMFVEAALSETFRKSA